MTSVVALSKGSEAVGHLTSAIQKFKESKGDAKKIASGCLDLVNTLSTFLPPPASEVTQLISSIANMFLGGGSPDTATLIKDEFARQTEVILDQFEKLKDFITTELDLQTIDEMKVQAQVRTFKADVLLLLTERICFFFRVC